MQYGSNQRESQQNQEKWRQWEERTRNRPHVLDFAKRWAELMEAELHGRRAHVADIAERTMQQAGSKVMRRQQIAEAIDALVECWKYGLSLKHWRSRRGQF